MEPEVDEGPEMSKGNPILRGIRGGRIKIRSTLSDRFQVIMRMNNGLNPRRLHVGLLILLGLASCATHPDYATQFRFPIEWGSISEGQQAFVDLECHQCHTVNGVDLMPYEAVSPVMLELGGTIVYAKTYADLVTSIINPSHIVSDEYLNSLPRDARGGSMSIMPFKSQMTVEQLIDLVIFLNSRYVLMEGYSEIYYH